jgi:hypothetical protein
MQPEEGKSAKPSLSRIGNVARGAAFQGLLAQGTIQA